MSSINETSKEVDEDRAAVGGLCQSIAEQLDHIVTENDAVAYLNEMTFGEAMTGEELMEIFTTQYLEWTGLKK